MIEAPDRARAPERHNDPYLAALVTRVNRIVGARRGHVAESDSDAFTIAADEGSALSSLDLDNATGYAVISEQVGSSDRHPLHLPSDTDERFDATEPTAPQPVEALDLEVTEYGQNKQIDPLIEQLARVVLKQPGLDLRPIDAVHASTFEARLVEAGHRRIMHILADDTSSDVDFEQLSIDDFNEAANLIDKVNNTPYSIRNTKSTPDSHLAALTYNVAYLLHEDNSTSAHQFIESAVLELLHEWGVMHAPLSHITEPQTPSTEAEGIDYQDSDNELFGKQLGNPDLTEQERSHLIHQGRSAINNVTDWLLWKDQNADDQLAHIADFGLQAELYPDEYDELSESLNVALGRESGFVARAVFQNLHMRLADLKKVLVDMSLAATNEVGLGLTTIAEMLADNLVEYADAHPPHPLYPDNPHPNYEPEQPGIATDVQPVRWFASQYAGLKRLVTKILSRNPGDEDWLR